MGAEKDPGQCAQRRADALQALPVLTWITGELNGALLPAMTEGRGENCRFAWTAWMPARALRFLPDTAQAAAIAVAAAPRLPARASGTNHG